MRHLIIRRICSQIYEQSTYVEVYDWLMFCGAEWIGSEASKCINVILFSLIGEYFMEPNGLDLKHRCIKCIHVTLNYFFIFCT